MNTTGNFLALTPADPAFKEILELDQAQFPKPWAQKDWLELNWDHHLLYAWDNGGVSAFALFARVPADDVAHLLKVCVTEPLRGSGLIRLFWNCCLENLKTHQVTSIYLEVESTNLRACAFYQKAGFQTLRKLKSYYSDGSDALTMQMIL